MHGRIVETTIESELLRENPLGDSHRREVLVYLPPGYDAGPSYPTIMLLAAFGSSHRGFLNHSLWEPNPVERFDRLVASGDCSPAILVMPDAGTRWGGSQFLDSSATGPYQCFLADEVVPFVDGRFRTLPRRESRAIAGRSSGGLGALRMIVDRPEVFAAAASHAGDAAFDISLRPMLHTAAIAFERAGGVEAFAAKMSAHGPSSGQDHEALFVLAAAAAYAPLASGPLPRAELPFDPQTAELLPRVWQRWCEADPLRRIEAAGDTLGETHLVFVDAGDADEYGLQFASRLVARALTDRGVTVQHEEFSGTHRGTSHRYGVSLPRLVAALDGP